MYLKALFQKKLSMEDALILTPSFPLYDTANTGLYLSNGDHTRT